MDLDVFRSLSRSNKQRKRASSWKNISTRGNNHMKDTVILVTSYGMGKADEKLQLTLIGKYLELILQNGNPPAAICFYTDGVKLVCEGSPVVEQLRALESKNIRL